MLLKYWIKIQTMLNSEEGQGMLEYALIIALIAIVVVVAITPLGNKIALTFNNITAKLN